MQPSADSRKKKRRRRRRRRLAACYSSRPAAGAAQGQCQCGSSSPGGGGGSGSLVARTPRAFSSCSSYAASSACAPAAAVHLGTQHKLTALLVALALLLVLPRPPLVAGVPVVSPRRMARIRSHVERINKTPVRSIEVRTRQRAGRPNQSIGYYSNDPSSMDDATTTVFFVFRFFCLSPG